jgi:hypothetical protein
MYLGKQVKYANALNNISSLRKLKFLKYESTSLFFQWYELPLKTIK